MSYYASQRKISRIKAFLKERGPSSFSEIAKGSYSSRFFTTAEVRTICIHNPDLFTITGKRGGKQVALTENGGE